jgi:hypothetical protein
LRKDFGARCGYSLQHFDTVGETSIHVDHIDPRQKKKPKQEYLNLLPATGHCNTRKNDFWPTALQRKAGARLLNPRKEVDYDEQIVECILSGELIGLTGPAEFQIRRLDLNDPFLCKERLLRTANHKLHSKGPMIVQRGLEFEEAKDFFETLVANVERLIPALKAATSLQVAAAISDGQITGCPPN